MAMLTQIRAKPHQLLCPVESVRGGEVDKAMAQKSQTVWVRQRTELAPPSRILRKSTILGQFVDQHYFHFIVRRLHGNISIYLHRMMFQTIQTIYFLKAYHLVMTMTETNTYKKTNTKTKTHIHRQRQIQSASKTQCMLYLSKAGGSRI